MSEDKRKSWLNLLAVGTDNPLILALLWLPLTGGLLFMVYAALAWKFAW